MNGIELLLPPAVVTITAREPSVAAASIVTVAVNVEESTTWIAAITTPVPPIDTVVAPVTKFVPDNNKLTEVPATADCGDTSVRVGSDGDGATIENVRGALDPPAVATVTSRSPSVAEGSIVKVVAKLVEPVTLTLPNVTPGPLTVTVVEDKTKFDPDSVRTTDVPVTPIAGNTELSVGAGRRMSNATGLLVPFGVWTMIWRVPSKAVLSMESLAVNVEGLITITSATVTPDPLTVTTVPPATKLLPERVMFTDAPAIPPSAVSSKVGPIGGSIEKLKALLIPLAVLTVTLRPPTAAVESTVNATLRLFALMALIDPTVTPVPLTATTVAPGTKFVPVIVRFSAPPTTVNVEES